MFSASMCFPKIHLYTLTKLVDHIYLRKYIAIKIIKNFIKTIDFEKIKCYNTREVKERKEKR